MLKASKGGEQTADMLLMLFGCLYDRQLLSYIDQVHKASAKVSSLNRYYYHHHYRYYYYYYYYLY